MKGRNIKILLADDHNVLREGLRNLLEQQPDMTVVAEVDNGRDAVRKALKLNPDMVIMDISMPNLNGIDATRQIVSSPNNTKVLCLSMHWEGPLVMAMLEAGASGYLLKSCPGRELIEAVRNTATGDIYLSPEIAGVVVRHRLRKAQDPKDGFCPPLTLREREVLQLVAEGHDTKRIAERLHISPKTVLAHRGNMMRKLDIDSINGLILYAMRCGLMNL